MIAYPTNANIKRLVEITCSGCRNTFFVRAVPDFQPSVCCYCGMAFESLPDFARLVTQAAERST